MRVLPAAPVPHRQHPRQQLPDAGLSGSMAFHAVSGRRRQSGPGDGIMTVAALLEAAGSGRSAPSAGHLKPYRYEGGLRNPRWIFPRMCAIRLSEVRSFRLTYLFGFSAPYSM